MQHRILIASAVVLIGFGARTAQGWNSTGHMAVAYLAWQKLTPAERARVAVLLQKNPYYQKWLANIRPGASEADRDMYLFMMAATWPDEIKAPASHYTGSDAPPKTEPATLNDGYTALQAHKYWHYVNTPLGDDATADTAPLTVPTVVEKITAFRAALATNEPDDLKSYDLVWLLHLVGDVHQPLHCVTRVSAANPRGDLGGNLVAITGPARELHIFWDTALGEGETGDFQAAVKSAAKLPESDPSLAIDDNEGDWAAESYALAKSAVYVDPVGPGLGPYTLTAAYTANAQQIAKQRGALAGARLARLIKEALQCDPHHCAN